MKFQTSQYYLLHEPKSFAKRTGYGQMPQVWNKMFKISYSFYILKSMYLIILLNEKNCIKKLFLYIIVYKIVYKNVQD